MQSTLFDTVLGGESMFSPQAPADATATAASASAKERALEAQDEFLGGLETSVTPVDQNAAASATAQPGHTDSNSSATTKLNTANNSFLDLQQLNGAGASSTAPNATGAGAGAGAATLLSQNTMYNLESLSTPSAMNDLLAMLDQEEDLNSTQPHSRLMSPKASYDASNNASYDASNEIPAFGMRAASNSFLDADTDAFAQGNANNSNEHLLPDIAEDNGAADPARKNSYVDPASTLALGGSLGNALVAGNPTPAGAAMHSSGMGWARRASELVSASQPPQMSMAPRQSISDSVDFWNLGSGPAPMHSQQQQQQHHRGSTSPLSPGNTHHRYSINEELSQALSGYNLNFSGSAADSNADSAIDMLSDNDNDNYAELQMGLGSPRQSVSVDFSLSSPHQPRAMNRGSVSAGADSNAAGAAGNELFYNLYSANDQLSGDYYHNMSMSSDDITPANVQSSAAAAAAATNAIPQDDLASPRKKFIKPSMMLADSASISAKLAFSGLQKKPETFPTIDTQSFHHPTKIVKRKSVSSTTPVNLRADQSRRRRKSTIGISSMSSFSTSPRNSASASSMSAESAAAAAAAASSASMASLASAKRNSSSNIAVSLLEDASAKPFQCKDCDKAFRRSEHLKRHVRSVHSTERPFPCMLCEKKFSRSDNLSQHLKTHKKHGDF